VEVRTENTKKSPVAVKIVDDEDGRTRVFLECRGRRVELEAGKHFEVGEVIGKGIKLTASKDDLWKELTT
jgi:hypothetical protein